METRNGRISAPVPKSFYHMLTNGQRIYSIDLRELIILYDLYSDSDRHAAKLLNAALLRTPEKGSCLSPRAICEMVTALGIKAHKEISAVLNTYNILYGFDGTNLLPGVNLDTSIVNPTVVPSVTKEEVLNAFYKVNQNKLHDHRFQIDYVQSTNSVDRNPKRTVYIFLDDVSTPRQKDIRTSPNHEGVPRTSKSVITTNGVVLAYEGIYYFSAGSTEELMMMMRGFLLKNHLLENRHLVCFSDGAKVIWATFEKWFS